MRMKERGLGTGAIVGIVVVVVAVVVGVVAAVLLIGGGGGPGGLSVYSGATKVGGDINYMGVTASVYTFTENAETVYNWYKSNVPSGWTLYSETGYTSYAFENTTYGSGTIMYEKGNDYGIAAIYEGSSAQAYGGDKVLLLAVGPKTALTT